MGESAPFDGELFDECGELLRDLEDGVARLRARAPDVECLESMQRSAHTVKGLVGFLGVEEMTGLARRLEEALTRLRDGGAEITSAAIDGVAEDATRLAGLLAGVAAPGASTGAADGAAAKAADGGAPSPNTPSWQRAAAAACAPKLKALAEAVGRVLDSFGVEGASPGPESVGTLCHTGRDLTVVARARGEFDAAVVFAFDSGVAQSLATKIASFMAGESVEPAAGDEAEFVRGALGEMVSFTVLAALNALALPPEFDAPCFVEGKGARLSPGAIAVRRLAVTTGAGEFEMALAPGAAVADAAELVSERGKAAPQRRRVAIADDSSVMRRTLERMLTQAGYEVVAHAANGREAIEAFRRERPDLLILDISMPVMGGLDALKVIRAEDPSARVLICSAIADKGTVRRGLTSGASGYITKPFESRKLVESVEFLFQEPAAPSEAPRGPAGGAQRPGVTALGIYRLGTPIGEGGMATVYEGYDPGLGRKVALKVINDELASDVDFVVRFLEEARAVAKVNHPNVVTIYFAGSDRGKHFFAMELLPGPDLGELVDRDGPMCPREALKCLRACALGLAAAAGQGLIHCDVKPSNLIFGPEGFVKVTDFGIARTVGAAEDASDIMGTPAFMAPEQVTEGPLDLRTDIYALGSSLHFLLTGEPPYDGGDGMEIALRHVHDPVPALPGVPRKVRRLLARMMAKSPEDRHADYAELIGEIERLC